MTWCHGSSPDRYNAGSQWRWSVTREGLSNFLETSPVPSFVSGMARGALGKGHPCVFKRCRSKALAKADDETQILLIGKALNWPWNQ